MTRLLRVLAAAALVATFTVVPAARAVADTVQTPTKGAEYTDGQDNRYLMGGSWLYRADPTDVGVSQGFWRDTASTTGWSPVSIPNSYNAGVFTAASMSGGVGWYRTDFRLPANAFAGYVPNADRRWILRFESVNYTATVWLNGHKLGTHAGAYLPFEYYLKGLRAGVNRLVVRVDDVRTPQDFPPGPSGGWWNFGGILREVYLRAVQRADIAQVMVRPLLPCPACSAYATIDEQASVHNPTGAAQTVKLTGVYGNLKLDFGTQTIAPGATWTAHASGRLEHPQLWSPDSPHLYRARLVLTDTKGQPLGGYTVLSGVRDIRRTSDGRLELNGRLLDLRGVFVHEQTLTTGGALTPAQLSAQIGWVKELGADLIRSHYPLAPQQLEEADRDGILVWAEIPVYQVKEPYLSQGGWQNRARALLKENILTNQNHPSVLLWSLGNELPTPVTGGEASYIKSASALARQLDPTRPVGMAVSDWPGVACQPAYAPLDVIGFNEYFGWFDAGGGTDDDRDALSPFMDTVRACYPKQALVVTEFGFEGARNGPVEERGTYQFQSNSVAFHLDVFATKSWLSGAIYFDLQDFAAKPGWSGGDPISTAPFVEKGLVNLEGQPKPAFAVVSSIYHATKQIAPLR